MEKLESKQQLPSNTLPIEVLPLLSYNQPGLDVGRPHRVYSRLFPGASVGEKDGGPDGIGVVGWKGGGEVGIEDGSAVGDDVGNTEGKVGFCVVVGRLVVEGIHVG